MHRLLSIASLLSAVTLCLLAPAYAADAPTTPADDPLLPCEVYQAQTNYLAPYYCHDRSLANANLAGRDLTRALLERTNLAGADLSRANLAFAEIRCSDLSNANLANAYSVRASYQGSFLAFANFTDADLTGIVIGDAPCRPTYNIRTTVLVGVNMTRARLQESTFVAWRKPLPYMGGFGDYPQYQMLEMRRANLSGANALKVRFMQTDLRLSSFPGAAFNFVDFIGSDLSCSDFSNSIWTKSTVYQGVMAGADFSGADLRTARFPDAQMTGAIFVGANLDGAAFDGAGLTYADFTGANIGGANFRNANLQGATWVDGTKCMEGSFGECKTTGNAMPPDPNASADVPRGAAYLTWSLADSPNDPEGAALFYDCPYSRADYSERPIPPQCVQDCSSRGPDNQR
ncbi:MAG: pentapeptide repeat-containing protein [Proteobacteria bacterium]|nr:pentapeptide repeat-containing protein [Pseudomonadota bacterium]